jgi:hypothetical protein
MNIKEEIINFCNTNEFKVIDNSKFEYLKNEIVFAKGGKIIGSALTIDNDNINDIIEEENDLYIKLKCKRHFSDNNVFYVIGICVLFEITNLDKGYKINRIKDENSLNIFLNTYFKKYLVTELNEDAQKFNGNWLPSWKYLYETLSSKLDDLSLKDKLVLSLINDALTDKTIMNGSIIVHLKTDISSSNIDGTIKIIVDLLPLSFKFGYYSNGKFIERFNNNDFKGTHTPTYFEKCFLEDVKVYDYSIKILSFYISYPF